MSTDWGAKELERQEWEWHLLLAYIGAKRTHEPEFRALFERIRANKDHAYHPQASSLSTLYDFTPLR